MLEGRDAVSCDDGWIRDWQRLRVADARVTRGSSGGATLTFVVSRPEAGNPVAVDYATADGTAVAGSDYSASSGRLVLEADRTSATIEVPVTSLARAGDDRRLSLTLSDPSGVAVFARDHAAGWILNRFFRPELQPDGEYTCDGGFYSIADRPEGGKAVVCLGHVVTPIVSAPVVDPRAGAATFTIRRPESAVGEYGSFFLAYRTVDGSASAGVDYTAVSGRLILSTNQDTTTVTVPVDPAAARDGRTFSLELTTDAPGTAIGVVDPVTRTVAPVTATATIRRLDGPIGLPASGIARVGSALPAGGADGWAWSRCDALGACQPIASATAQSYTPTAADAGLLLRVRATAADPDGGTQIGDSEPVGPVRPPAAAPIFTAGPSAGAVLRSADAAFSFSGKESDAAYECSLDGAAFAACDAPLSLTGLASGRHSLSVRQRTVDEIASAATTRDWAVAAAPDGAAACDGTAFTATVVAGRDAISCDDGGIRDWQRVAIADAAVTRSSTAGTTLSFAVSRPEAGSPLFLRYRTIAGSALRRGATSPPSTTCSCWRPTRRARPSRCRSPHAPTPATTARCGSR